MKKIGIKLFLLFFGCTVSLVTAVGFFSYYKSKGIIEDKLSLSTKQTIEQAADKLDLIFGNFENTATQILADQNFLIQTKQYFALPDHAPDKTSLAVSTGNWLNSIAGNHSGIDGVYLIPVDGSMMVSSTFHASQSGKRTMVSEEWFKRIVQGEGSLIWLEPRSTSYSSARKEAVFALGRLLVSADKNGKKYVLLMEIRKEVLDSVLDKIKLSDSSRNVILDDEGRLVQSPDLDQIGERFDLELSKEQFALAQEQAETVFVDGAEGSKQLVAFKKMSTSGWNVTAAAPLAELTKETDTILWLTVIMIVISIGLTSAAGYFVARMIGLPLTNLRNLMKEGEQGNLTVRTDFRSKDEIGQLGSSFNRMMEQITKLMQQTAATTNDVLETAAKLLQVSRQTASSADEIAVANEQVADRAVSLAVEAEKGYDLTNRIGSQMEQVQGTNAEMAGIAAEIREVSESGANSMTELAAQTNLMEINIRSMVERVHSLKQSAVSIRKVLDLLKKIAKQTNILSLNAAIEAGRANTTGKQFLVVAAEIRNLAVQSKHSIEEVENMTDLIQREMDETVAVMSEVYPVFSKQVDFVKEARVIFEQVQFHMGLFSGSLQEITASIHSLNQSQSDLTNVIGHVSALSQESSATSEQVASLSFEQLSIGEQLLAQSAKLERLSLSLKESLKNFKI